MPTINLGFPDTPSLSARDALIGVGPTLHVEIGFDPSFNPNGISMPNLPTNQFPALVDTGAFESCIDSTLAEQLGLPIVGRQSVSGAHGAAEVNFHLAQIHAPFFQHIVYGRFAGVHLAKGGQLHQALLGRTFLMNFKMMYDGQTGVVTLSDD